ncbi:MAG: pentapeptide repeat-containing protein [Anaerolineaceae bacterium]|nr:pentapeptide repeat-containing protein [Anaerolineaceae bacterium]
MDNASEAEVRKWWQSDIGRLGILVAAFILIVVFLYQVEWSGLQGKNVWDWLELIIVPLVLAGGGLFLQRIEEGRNKREESLEKEREERQAEREKQQARDNLMDSIFQSYLDDMSDLMIRDRLQTMLDIVTADRLQKKSAANSQKGAEASSDAIDNDTLAEATAVVTVARSRTITAFKSLDVQRRNLVANFLRETGLVTGERGTLLAEIRLTGMDLSRTDFYKFNFSTAVLYSTDFGGSNLFHANLSGAYLFGANLSHTDLSNADLRQASLHRANLKQAYLKNTRFDEKTALPDAEVIAWNDEATQATYTKYWSQETDMMRYADPKHPDFWQLPNSNPNQQGGG